MRFAHLGVKKQWENALSNDNNTISDELKLVSLFKEQILLQNGIFKLNIVE